MGVVFSVSSRKYLKRGCGKIKAYLRFNPVRVEFLTTVGKQPKNFKHLILYSISIVVYSKIDILAVS